MNSIFNQGDFSAYSRIDLREARSDSFEISHYQKAKTTVFISHKHDELDDLKGFIGFLEKNYKVKAYIDSQDPTMPKITSPKTARTIKSRIKSCERFILLATNEAVTSKWCNWELGFGDAHKYPEHIALVPMKPKGTSNDSYKGTEYMKIYPYIAYYNGTEKYTDGRPIKEGYYVVTEKEGKSLRTIMPLSKWLGESEIDIF